VLIGLIGYSITTTEVDSLYTAYVKEARSNGFGDVIKAQELIRLSRQIDYVDIEVKCRLSLINSFMDNGPKAHKALDSIAPLLNQNTKISLWLDYYYFRALAFSAEDKLDRAVENALIGLNIADSLKDTTNIIFYYSLLGNLNSDIGDQRLALKYMFKVFDHFKALGDATSQFQVMQNIALALTVLNEDSAKSFFIESLRVYDSGALSLNVKKLQSYVQLGMIYINEGVYDSAEYCLVQSEDFFRLKPEEVYNSSLAYDNWDAFISLYLAKGEYDKAKRYLTLIKDLADSIDIIPYHKRYLEQAIRLELHDPNHLSDSNFNKYVKLVDESFERRRMDEAIAMQEKFQSLEKDKEILELANRNQQSLIKSQRMKNTIIIISAASISIVLLISVFIFRNRYVMNKKLIRLKNQALQLQINPHFFFNAMNSIGAYVSKNNPKEAKYYLSKFARLMRLTLENSQSEFVHVEREIEMLESYIVLEKVRKDVFDYHFEVPEHLTKFKIPSLMLQPFIENSIKHGFNNDMMNNRRGEIKVSVQMSGDKKVKVEIEDNGIGFNANQPEDVANKEHNSMALKILNERLDNYNMSKYGIKFENIGASNGQAYGTRVTFYLPLILN
jgi:tetratricopeptide (TPR) repeat protein